MSGFDAYAAELRRALRPSPANLLVMERADSTNRLARQVVSEYAGDGLEAPRLWIFAWEQRAGRGRLGRSWVSPAGLGIYATVSLGRLPLPELGALPLVVAGSLAATINSWVGGRCRLKWPNDLVADGRKLGGILIESVSRGVDAAAAIVGFGVNHRRLPADLNAGNATSLEELAGSAPPLAPAAAALAMRLEEDLLRPAEASIERYVALSAHRPGDPIRCRCAEEVVDGRFAGFDRRGFLRLACAGGERLLAAGEVIEA